MKDIKLNLKKIIKTEIIIAFFICIITYALYAQIKNHQFIYDAKLYITLNDNIQKGLTIEGVKWAMTSTYASNWHPVTWISHMIDISLYGINPKGHNASNVFFHILNSVLLFFLFFKLTNGLWQSAFVAILFALHPLHIESVAWASARKDLLSCFFGLLTILFYSFYVNKKENEYYFLALFFFILGLMSKPMLVTLPFVLLLLEYWPLNRIEEIKINAKNINIILTKLPFFALSFASCIITFIIQKESGAVHLLPIKLKIYNVFSSYVLYLYKAFIPFKLAILYPYDKNLGFGLALFFFIILCGISAVFFYKRKKYPYLLVGWLWYLGMLVPVIGIVQVGMQKMADRYTYIPLVGIFFLISFFIGDISKKLNNRKPILFFLSIIIICFYFNIANQYIKKWKNPYTLFNYAIANTKNNAIAHNNIGVNYSIDNRLDTALSHFKKALEINPNHAKAKYNLGVTYFKQKKYDQALKPLAETIRRFPKDASLYARYAQSLIKLGREKEAQRYYNIATKLRRDF